MSCGFEAETDVASGYDDGLPAKVGGGVGKRRELGDEERADEVMGTERLSAEVL